MDAMTQTSQHNYKLQAENKKLREKLETAKIIFIEMNDKDKEILEWREAARSEAEEVNRLQAENKKLREALKEIKE
jgi:regulator of replication initiation timing